jgi:hypothetical protein
MGWSGERTSHCIGEFGAEMVVIGKGGSTVRTLAGIVVVPALSIAPLVLTVPLLFGGCPCRTEA